MTLEPTMIQLSPRERELLAETAAREGISRSELMRRALRAYLAESREALVSDRIRDGYTRIPESDDEVPAATAGARRLLTDPDLAW
jgi:hypothetical protein